MAKMSAFHRRQLRAILGIKWPAKISNEALYRRTNAICLEDYVRSCRLRLFGHILRLDTNTPAQIAMDMYMQPGKRARGRPKCMLPTRLNQDLKMVNKQLKTSRDLASFRQLASDRSAWKATFHRM